MGFKRVSEAVIRRLPRYYRHLTMLETQGVERISSERLARQMNLNASQVRQDFNCFGGFGQQGYGYNVSNLPGEINRPQAHHNNCRCGQYWTCAYQLPRLCGDGIRGKGAVRRE